MNFHKLIKRYVVEDGNDFRIKDHDPADPHELNSEDKPEAKEYVAQGVQRLSEMQDMLYAQCNWGLLLIFQGMDAAGKDGTVKHALSSVNPQRVDVYSFKAPSSEELSHDFLWRTNRYLPPRGKIGIFNRSYYEEVLVVRVHPELLKKEGIPDSLCGDHLWRHRYEDINALEKYLTRNGIAIRKFLLNISKKEQKKRFLARLADPKKNWKFSPADVGERQFWHDYMTVYEKMIRNTATGHAPWVVVPADNKWFTRLLVVATIVDALENLDLKYPKLGAAERAEWETARKLLEKE